MKSIIQLETLSPVIFCAAHLISHIQLFVFRKFGAGGSHRIIFSREFLFFSRKLKRNLNWSGPLSKSIPIAFHWLVYGWTEFQFKQLSIERCHRIALISFESSWTLAIRGLCSCVGGGECKRNKKSMEKINNILSSNYPREELTNQGRPTSGSRFKTTHPPNHHPQCFRCSCCRATKS